ncbi:hypothetical protein TREMEDRAFT_57195 [Tremella mesenterica DSM 1558]|uniref:uncharacterized protein n=1 Tax=Tremella mesenterica (strain ATCC 24925 / CBS 8224 / DSM 1558 / NBRC 9311 / NRRL Y-6157 / RJB 2259-6 / UBC 559-6) TaxID=578456 RepID=UPI0003F48D93|nr:uncharacterized protein TREMEDRAFT_57195 [Tremella mesenterica DSM 1558]EIW68695.1 hypothetical protein TREMEDRAFT_57195 [Tremella mesenterica DSM 1558]
MADVRAASGSVDLRRKHHTRRKDSARRTGGSGVNVEAKGRRSDDVAGLEGIVNDGNG